MLICLLTIFVLSSFVGCLTIWNVPVSLHSALMSVTNAISGVVIIGGITLVGNTEHITILIIGSLAIFLATINLAGGFEVSHRMLEFFRKRK